MSPRRVLAEYEYDALNQLIAETRYTYSDPATTVSCTFGYDTAGNLRTVTDETGTHTYTYTDPSWADLLTSYDGHSITYDATGNPSNWYNGKTYTGLTWQKGRQLAALQVGSKNVSYAYDVTGIRSSKTVGSTVHLYVTQSGRVVRETYGARVLDFIYGADGRPFAVKYSADSGATFTTYYYVLNVQGDVMGLLNSNGALIVKYTYDAWGRALSVTNANGTPLPSSANIANINPLRYRGYYYDTDTGFYYLQSRYYDPALGRFINADSYASTGQGFLGYNMFTYCGNNPVIFIDKTGAQAVAVPISGGGGGTRSSKIIDVISKMIKKSNKLSNPEHLFYICYQNTFHEDYVAPCGSMINISYHVIDEYTKTDQTVDSGIIGAIFGIFGYYLTKGLGGTAAFGFTTGIISNLLLDDTHPSEIIITVIEWDWCNDPLGRSDYNGYGARYDYILNDNMTLTLAGRWQIKPNPYYTSNSVWNANGDHWG